MLRWVRQVADAAGEAVLGSRPVIRIIRILGAALGLLVDLPFVPPPVGPFTVPSTPASPSPARPHQSARAPCLVSSLAASPPPVVQPVPPFFPYYPCFGIATEVMGARFRSVGQFTALAGFYLLTISPDLLATLAATEAPLQRALAPTLAQALDLAPLSYDEAGFRFAPNEGAMATETLAESIRTFCVDAVTLYHLLLGS